MEWRHRGSLRPKKFGVQKSALKVLVSIRFFWDQDGILLIHYLPQGQTINAEYYSSLLVQIKDILKEKRRGKITKEVLFLNDNAPVITHPILLIWPRRTTACSMDWKKQLKGRHFSSDAEAIAAAETWLDGQPTEFFLIGLQNLEQGAKECIELRGECVE